MFIEISRVVVSEIIPVFAIAFLQGLFCYSYPTFSACKDVNDVLGLTLHGGCI